MPVARVAAPAASPREAPADGRCAGAGSPPPRPPPWLRAEPAREPGRPAQREGQRMSPAGPGLGVRPVTPCRKDRTPGPGGLGRRPESSSGRRAGKECGVALEGEPAPAARHFSRCPGEAESLPGPPWVRLAKGTGWLLPACLGVASGAGPHMGAGAGGPAGLSLGGCVCGAGRALRSRQAWACLSVPAARAGGPPVSPPASREGLAPGGPSAPPPGAPCLPSARPL